MVNKTIVIVHGWGSNPNDNWYPWLKSKFLGQADVIIPELPNAKNPKSIEWISYLNKILPSPTKDTLYIGYALGSITVLNYLQLLKLSKLSIAGYILVSGFDVTFPHEPLDPIDAANFQAFTSTPLDYKYLTDIAKNRGSITSANDPAVPINISLNLSKKLMTESILVENAGRFTTSDGYTEFDELFSLSSRYLK